MPSALSALVVAVLLFCSTVMADRIYLSDGRVFDGRLLLKTSEKVVFSAQKTGIVMRLSFPANDVIRIEEGPSGPATAAAPVVESVPVSKGLPEGAPPPPPIEKLVGTTYCLVPLSGTVGVTFSTLLLEASLADALRRDPTVTIIEVDSPGGFISEVAPMIEVLERYQKRMRLVLWCKTSISAAAITSLAVNDIYVRRSSQFGAATAYKLNAITGIPENIEEKSASIWRATARSSAEVGRHSPLLAEAMIDGTLPLYLCVSADGKTYLSRQPEGARSRLFKEARKLLTLTGSEAVECGLASGIADSIDEIRAKLGFSRWTEYPAFGPLLAQFLEKKSVVDSKRVADALVTLNKELEFIYANDPSIFKDYYIDQRGELTAESANRLQHRVTKAVASAGRAEQAINTIEQLRRLNNGVCMLLAVPDTTEVRAQLAAFRRGWQNEMRMMKQSGRR